MKILNAASPDGYNKAHINHGSANTQDTFGMKIQAQWVLL